MSIPNKRRGAFLTAASTLPRARQIAGEAALGAQPSQFWAPFGYIALFNPNIALYLVDKYSIYYCGRLTYT
jgi:hypothetical protein